VFLRAKALYRVMVTSYSKDFNIDFSYGVFST